jgi:ATP-binding cassette subfamily C (CFTR/MRP) protein 4
VEDKKSEKTNAGKVELHFDKATYSWKAEKKEETSKGDKNYKYTEAKKGIEEEDDEQVNVLEDLSFSANPGDLIAVIGTVGAGKSSLLFSIMRETILKSGISKINGKLAYVEQEPFILSCTVKDNILFGNEFNEERFDKAISGANLIHDVAQLEKGVDTMIGERGINISGGQKARISFARAIYQDADIYLLDDPLSAVDPPVAQKIFNEGIRGALEGKIRILVTH